MSEHEVRGAVCSCGWDPQLGWPSVNAQQARNMIRHMHIVEEQGLSLPEPETVGDLACDELKQHAKEVRLGMLGIADAHASEIVTRRQARPYRRPTLAVLLRALFAGVP